MSKEMFAGTIIVAFLIILVINVADYYGPRNFGETFNFTCFSGEREIFNQDVVISGWAPPSNPNTYEQVYLPLDAVCLKKKLRR